MLVNKNLISCILFAFFRKMSKAKKEKKDEKRKKKAKSRKKRSEDDVTSLNTSKVNTGVTIKSKKKSVITTTKGKKSKDGNKGFEKFIVREGFYTKCQKVFVKLLVC